MTEITTVSERVFAAFAAVATTFTLMVVSFAPPAATVSGVIV